MEMKRGRLMDDLNVLPPEIITEILSRLPADSAVGCRCVCKQWRTLIDDPSFVDTHTCQVISSSSFNLKKFGNYLLPASSSGFFLFAAQGFGSFGLEFIEYNDDEHSLVPDFKLINKPISGHPFPFAYGNCSHLLISSCNGLVFMGPTKPNDIFVCNPFTREYVNLRNPITIAKNYTRWSRQAWGSMTYGFGYNPSTNEYKIVSIYYQTWSKIGKGKVSVYTFGSGKWRNKRKRIPYNLLSIHHQPGVLANGAIHWYTDHEDDKKIVSFDLVDEEFRVIVPLPPPTPSAPYYYDQLGMLGGCLCVTRSRTASCQEIPRDIWILNVNNKKGNDEEEGEFSWNRKFSIPWKKENSSQPKPCVILKSGKILLYHGNKITSYDLKNETLYEDVSITPNCKGFCMMIPCTKSFLSLKSLGEEDAKCFGGLRFAAHALAQKQQQG